MTRVVHLTSAHPPFDTRIFHKECRTLASAGYDVTLVVPDGPVGDFDGVHMLCVPGSRSRWGRVGLTQRNLWRTISRLDADVVHLHDPDLLPMALLLSLKGHTVVFDSHEDVVRQLAGRAWIPRPLRRAASLVVGLVERFVVQFCAAVVSAEPAGAQRFPPRKTVVVQNFPLTEEFADLVLSPHSGRDAIVFYVGDITRARGAVKMVEAVGLLPPDLQVSFKLAGRMSEPTLRQELEGLPGWERTEYLGFIDREQLRRWLSRSRVGLVVMQPTQQYREATQPVKLFEYLAAGLPVVASNFETWRPFVQGPDCGELVDPTDPQAIADALERLLRDPRSAESRGWQGREAVMRDWTWLSQGQLLIDLYATLVGPPE